jgi:hypothetical protein
MRLPPLLGPDTITQRGAEDSDAAFALHDEERAYFQWAARMVTLDRRGLGRNGVDLPRTRRQGRPPAGS